jgi:hypothetical protein
LPAGVGVHDIVSDMSEQRMPRSNSSYVIQRLFHVQMRRMRGVAQRIDDQQIESAQLLERLFRNQITIGHERDLGAPVVQAKRGHFGLTVDDRDRPHLHSADLKIASDRLRGDLRQTAADVLNIEDVMEDLPQLAQRVFAREEWNRALPEIYRADIIEPEDVIGVAVRDQQRIDPVDLFPESLLPEVGGYIDDQTLIIILDHESGAQPFIARIARSTDMTGAPDHRYADGCPGS